MTRWLFRSLDTNSSTTAFRKQFVFWSDASPKQRDRVGCEMHDFANVAVIDFDNVCCRALKSFVHV